MYSFELCNCGEPTRHGVLLKDGVRESDSFVCEIAGRFLVDNLSHRGEIASSERDALLAQLSGLGLEVVTDEELLQMVVDSVAARQKEDRLSVLDGYRAQGSITADQAEEVIRRLADIPAPEPASIEDFVTLLGGRVQIEIIRV